MSRNEADDAVSVVIFIFGVY